MPGSKRYYWGDFRLWREAIAHVESDERGIEQVFQGVDRREALHVPLSPNFSLGVDVACLGAPHPSSKDQKGWRATYAKVRASLRLRSESLYPLVWIDDDSLGGVVDTVLTSTSVRPVSPTQLVAGDMALIVRGGGTGTSFSLVSISSVVGGAGELVYAAVTGTTLGTAMAGDLIHRVEAYYIGMQYRSLGPAPFSGKGDWYGKELLYRFVGPGLLTYSRTATSTVGA